MGIGLIAGRSASESDRPRRVVVISEMTAQSLWPGENPIGKTFKRGDPGEPAHEVIGVAAGIRDKTLEQEPGLIVYVPLWERVPSSGSIAVRTAGDARTAAGALVEAVRRLDAGLPVSEVQTMEQIERGSLWQRAFQMLLIGLFAGSALLLSGVGIYSLVASAVARRTGEIGVRRALGAQRFHIMSMIFSGGLRPVAIGMAVGIGGSLMIGRSISSMLFGVSPYDLKTMLAVVALTSIVTVVACWVPARRAVRVDPIEALRYE
jgi:putative ABC transport system permease protein